MKHTPLRALLLALPLAAACASQDSATEHTEPAPQTDATVAAAETSLPEVRYYMIADT